MYDHSRGVSVALVSIVSMKYHFKLKFYARIQECVHTLVRITLRFAIVSPVREFF